MKAFSVLAATAALSMLALDSVSAMQSYLKQLPNGELFEMNVGHITTDKLNDFGKAFSAAGSAWSTKFCQSTFPGTTMTVGQAFGDPCCTWKVGQDADKTVNAWDDKPITATVCDTASKAPTAVPGPALAAPAADKAAPAAAPAATPAPAGKTPSLRPASKCGVKSDSTQRESKSLDDDSEAIDY